MELYAVAVLRGGQFFIAPDEQSLVLLPNDKLLMAGAASSQYRLAVSLRDERVLTYVLDGIDRPDGWIWRWFAARKERAKAKKADVD